MLVQESQGEPSEEEGDAIQPITPPGLLCSVEETG